MTPGHLSGYPITLDFIRLGPQGQQGAVVARVSFADVLLGDLVELVNTHWQAYTEEAGIPPEAGFSQGRDHTARYDQAMYDPAIYRIGRRHPEFVGLWGGRIVEVSGDAVLWAKGLSFGQLCKECRRRRLYLTTADGYYTYSPERIGYGDV